MWGETIKTIIKIGHGKTRRQKKKVQGSDSRQGNNRESRLNKHVSVQSRCCATRYFFVFLQRCRIFLYSLCNLKKKKSFCFDIHFLAYFLDHFLFSVQSFSLQCSSSRGSVVCCVAWASASRTLPTGGCVPLGGDPGAKLDLAGVIMFLF